jgi:threonine aldolase
MQSHMAEPRIIDLRSDTVTKPTPAMREAMANAEVGDDVFGEDPTVKRLEALAAAAVGKEAAVYVSSGTMGNLASLLAHCRRGDEAIVGSEAHILQYEVAGAAGLGGIQLRPIENDAAGVMAPDEIVATIRVENIHMPRTAAVCLENTHNRCGGSVLTPEYTAEVAGIAHRAGAAVHLDGARIFNASVALGVPVPELTADVDSVTFCLSKGLSAPVGSLVCGSAEFVARARKARKALGGGMRQAGVIAAAGIVALETMVDRLAEDHANARRLAEGLAELPGIAIDPARVRTNIVIFELHRDDLTPDALQDALAARGVRIFAIGGARLRAVTHYEVTREGIEAALGVFGEVLGLPPPVPLAPL